VEGIEEDPHGVGRIRKLAVGERVSGEQVAEFVMGHRDRHWKQPKNREASKDGRNGDNEDGRAFSRCQAREEFFSGSQPAVPEPGRDED